MHRSMRRLQNDETQVAHGELDHVAAKQLTIKARAKNPKPPAFRSLYFHALLAH